MAKKPSVSRKKPHPRKFGPLIFIAIILSLYGFYQSSKTTHEDCYAVVFAWLLFAIVWAIIAIIRYENLQGKC